MILSNHDYNPLPIIFALLPLNLEAMTVEILEAIQHELFKAGIKPETIQEFDIVLGLLIETLKEYYGKK